jgi:hypothetical protein
MMPHTAGLLRLAEKLGNVGMACRTMGYSRDGMSVLGGFTQA